MVKVKESWTIEHEFSKKLREMVKENPDFTSVSEIVNHAIDDFLSKNTDIYEKIDEIELKIINLLQEKQQILQKLEEIIQEGNKKEKKDARKRLKIEQEKQEKIRERLKQCVKKIKELGLIEQLKKCENLEDCQNLAREIYKIIVIKNQEPIMNSVGVVDLMKLIPYKELK